ncbi:MAG: ABC transporter permease [Gemmatimonadetes bacterium]|nr:ABC transporter permease [Gemmatimonadota bacterium]
MDTLFRDLRIAFRSLYRRPGFALAATATLALGIGANTTLFSLADAVLLEPPRHLDQPERIVALYTSDYSGPQYGSSSYPDYYDLRAETASFESVASFELAGITIGEAAALEQRTAGIVSPEYFEVLGVRPGAGRFFDESDDGRDGIVISHALWRVHLGASPTAVGNTLRINQEPYTILGIAPEGFVGFDRVFPADVWIPARTALQAGLDIGPFEDRTSRGIAIVARLAPGVSVDQAQSRMDAFAARMHAAYDRAWTDVRGEVRRLTVVPERLSRVPPDNRTAVVSLFGVLGATVGIILLICCANVAGLLLARAAGRAREVGIRVAIGAGRGRVIRQLLTESLLLAGLGALAGTALAFWAADLLSATGLTASPLGLSLSVDVDGSVLGFTAVVTILTGVLFGLAPALVATRFDVAHAIRAGTPTLAGRSRTSVRSAFVAAQLALSLLLLIGALLLARTLRAAWAVDPGFRTHDALLFSIAPLPGIETDVPVTAQRISERLSALPGVSAVTWGSARPFTGFGSRRGMRMEGYQPGPGEDMEVHLDRVGPSYFETLEIPITSGRGFTAADRAGAQRVVVVNEAFVRRYWNNLDPLGRTISMGGSGEFMVVGVARDVRFMSIREPARPRVWIPALQESAATLWFVRASSGAQALLPGVAAAVAEVAPGWAVSSAQSMDDRLSSALFEQRVAGGALGLFALLAVGLAGIGLYGVIAFAVSQRTREIGIRLALGARPVTVNALFVRQALPLILTGSGLGIVAALAGTRVLTGLLIGVGATDTLTFVGAPAFLTGIALLACWIPARRAARVDPISALRTE